VRFVAAGGSDGFVALQGSSHHLGSRQDVGNGSCAVCTRRHAARHTSATTATATASASAAAAIVQVAVAAADATIPHARNVRRQR